jgi:AcrR family transcriptional regulator
LGQDQPTGRRRRADAQRNRERLLATAKAMFSRSASEISLDDVAAEAGVGVGTVYRHFPTRDALVEAVYRTEVESLAADAERLGADREPLAALREWMRLFVDYIATKHLIAPALNAMVGGPSAIYADSGRLIKDAITRLVGRAVAAGELRDDLDPIDLLRALVGVANVSAGPGWEESAKRLVDILIAGSKPGAVT